LNSLPCKIGKFRGVNYLRGKEMKAKDLLGKYSWIARKTGESTGSSTSSPCWYNPESSPEELIADLTDGASIDTLLLYQYQKVGRQVKSVLVRNILKDKNGVWNEFVVL
jgi:hypothetical protein